MIKFTVTIEERPDGAIYIQSQRPDTVASPREVEAALQSPWVNALQLTESNRQLREELERVKILALRIYPDLKASGICSAHSDDGHFDCETCYPNWKELAKAHCDLKQKAWTALAAAKEALRLGGDYIFTSEAEHAEGKAPHIDDVKTAFDSALARIAECEDQFAEKICVVDKPWNSPNNEIRAKN